MAFNPDTHTRVTICVDNDFYDLYEDKKILNNDLYIALTSLEKHVGQETAELCKEIIFNRICSGLAKRYSFFYQIKSNPQISMEIKEMQGQRLKKLHELLYTKYPTIIPKLNKKDLEYAPIKYRPQE